MGDLTPVSALDVAAYALERHGPMPTFKLQKLVYYSQAWCLVWNGGPLFEDSIEAWTNGPVTVTLYREHRGHFSVAPGDIGGDPDRLSAIQKGLVDAVLGTYGQHDGETLSELTHQESPWQEARKGVPKGAPSSMKISQESIMHYYRTQLDDIRDRLDAAFDRVASSDDLAQRVEEAWRSADAGELVEIDDLDSI